MRGQFRLLLQALAAFCLALSAGPVLSQPFSNSWINFSNTYYKFRISKDGVYRITKAQLDAIGMGNVSGSQFAVFREGRELPLYTSASGVFGNSDYIELYAGKADGKMDTELYPDASWQPSTDVNLLSDTAYYFLTFDNTPHQRIQVVNSVVPSPAPSPAAYCWVTAAPALNIRGGFSPGRSHNVNPSIASYFYSADYDRSEGYAYNAVATNDITVNIPTPGAYSSGPSATLSFVFGTHTILNGPFHPVVSLNAANVFDTLLDAANKFQLIRRALNIGAASLQAGNNPLRLSDNFNMFLLDAKIRYPRTYSFSGDLSASASFQVPASDRYLEISGLNTSGQPVRLYDRTHGKLYTGMESGSVVRFYLDAATQQRDMYLSTTPAMGNVGTLSRIQFRDYTQAANQGDYIILSHKNYIDASPGYVNQFRDYRGSAAGGSYKPVVVDVTELYNQFGYGYEFNPLGIKNFVAYARASWTVKPEYMFIIGRGVDYTRYLAYTAQVPASGFSLVPTWGNPGSDNLLSSFNNDQKPVLATGRLSAWNNAEIGAYLTKVQAYENAVKPLTVPTVAHEYWKKKALHIVGSTDINQQNALLSSLNACKAIFVDTFIGGEVTTIRKETTSPVEQVENARIDSLMTNGLAYVSFYGHGSTQGFDFNLNTPDDYNVAPKFPIFSSFACQVASIFEMFSAKTISELYIASVSGGSIAMLAGNNSGWTGTLPAYMQNQYRNITSRYYGQTLGKQYQKNIEWLQDNYLDDFMDIHTQCMLFQGDPALSMYNPDKPDYVVEASSVSTIPTQLTTQLTSFQVKAIVYNLGKATGDSVLVRIQHTRAGSGTVYYADSVRLPRLDNTDTLYFTVPLDASRDIGLNNYTVKVDADERYEEVSEQNNQVTLPIYIYSENLQPVYPKEFAIVHAQDVTLKASTLNAFAPLRTYRLELDTTMNFDSPLRQSTQLSSMGGVLQWKPNVVYRDSVVYYWRATLDSMVNGEYRWTASSFIYLANGSDGWNQSHYYQYKRNEPFNGLELPAASRRFTFSPSGNSFKATNKVFRPSLSNYGDISQSINDYDFDSYGCLATGSFQVVVIDSANGRAWDNALTGPGLYGSAPYCRPSNPVHRMFEYPTNSTASRNAARLFLESIPNGSYIMVKNLVHEPIPPYQWDGQTINEWMADSSTVGAGNTLYDAVKNLGFDRIDEYTSLKTFIFFGRKGDNTFPVQQAVSNGLDDKIQIESQFLSFPDTGVLKTEVVGPALAWQSLKWRTSATGGAPQNDSPYVAIYGIDTSDAETLLYSGFSRDTSLSFISAAQYPNLRLQWSSVDNLNRTSAHLDYWRVLYDPAPEAALNAAAHYEYLGDSLSEGQQGRFYVAISNLTPKPMDSMLVSVKIIDVNGVRHTLQEKRYKPLAANDTLIAGLDLDVSAYHGQNTLFVEANPNNDQPEQYHPNNLGYLPLHVKADKENPLLDVTFDGVHILDKDIVSAKPFIKVQLRDENKFMALSDSTLLTLQLKKPNQSSPVEIPQDGTICRFFPAQMVNGKKNEAYIEYRPELIEDGEYKLLVSGKDKVGNQAGNAAKYEINFTVDNKPSITHVLNYPNPFSTATQFIFTMTGSEIPSQFKIQILTVTGKVVREIKKHELGDLHIGRNITDYRWDGKDEYGQMLGNGVYLYRVVTSIRGEEVAHRRNEPVDKFFKNGYGKLYIMR